MPTGSAAGGMVSWAPKATGLTLKGFRVSLERQGRHRLDKSKVPSKQKHEASEDLGWCSQESGGEGTKKSIEGSRREWSMTSRRVQLNTQQW